MVNCSALHETPVIHTLSSKLRGLWKRWPRDCKTQRQRTTMEHCLLTEAEDHYGALPSHRGRGPLWSTVFSKRKRATMEHALLTEAGVHYGALPVHRGRRPLWSTPFSQRQRTTMKLPLLILSLLHWDFFIWMSLIFQDVHVKPGSTSLSMPD